MALRTFCLIALLVATAACSRKAAGPPYSPQEELSRFHLPPGFHAELVAAEPEVIDPVAMAFDERGRIYAVEMRDYPMGDHPAGRVRLLEDKDGDGRFETSSVFVDNLKLPNGVMVWRKGILVTSTPDILYFEDTNGDGKADVRKVVLTGFASQNPQLRLNGPQYGYDNWIYAAYTRRFPSHRYAQQFGDLGGPIHFPDRPDIKALDTHSRDIRFRPDQGQLEALAGFSQFGWGFNEFGDRFVVWNSDHIRNVPIDDATTTRNPYQTIASQMASVSDHKPQSTVYPITENPHYIHDSQVGQFTSACGLSVYTGANLTPDFQDSSLTCEPVHNLVHRDILKPQGGSYVASRAYENSEFMASKDSWFRPVFTMTGPDGALYVVDLYRASVEHPEFVPPEMLKDLDFHTKANRGRIWRVVHESTRRRPAPNLLAASDADLVKNLADPNMWWRLQSQRLLVDRKATGAEASLLEMARQGSTPFAKMHALWTLDGLGLLKPEVIAAALADADPTVRRQAIRLAKIRPDDKMLHQKVKALVNDPNPQVRYDLALLMAGWPEPEAFAPLRQIVFEDPDDPWLQTVALSNARDNPLLWFRAAVSSPKPSASLVAATATLIGNKGRDADVAAVLATLSQASSFQHDGLKGLADGVNASQVKGEPHPQAAAAVTRMLSAIHSGAGEAALRIAATFNVNPAALIPGASKTAGNNAAPVAERVQAVGILGLSGPAAVAAYMAPQFPAEVRLAAVKAAARARGEAAVKVVLDNYRAMTAPMRTAANPILFRSAPAILALFDALENNQVPMWAVDGNRARALQNHQDAAVRDRAKKLFAEADADRKKVYTQYLPAVHRDGDPAKGKLTFERVCAECHLLEGKGNEVGPDLRGVAKRYKEALLANILLPNENVEPGYEEYVVETKDGRTLTGILAKDTPSSIVLRRAKGEEDTVARSEIKEMRTSGASPMPDGLEKDITIEQMADLIAYLKVPK